MWLVPWQSAHAQAVMQTVRVTMPDGVELATDVWTKLGDTAKHPVLLRRTPYGRAVDAATAANIVALSYILVSQDVRGRGDSAGAFLPFFDDEVDGTATIDWIAAQTWSNGRVGSYSSSAEGIVQYMAMAGAPEALRCAHVSVPTHDVYEGIFPGGAWRTDLGTNWLTNLGATDVIAEWKTHEVRDSYWDEATLSPLEMAKVDHPVFIVGGMFDIFAPSQVRAHTELKANVAESARDDIFLVLGPWTHGGVALRRQGELMYPADAPYADNALDLLNFMDYCLNDAARPAFSPVRYYLTELTDETTVDATDGKTVIVANGEWRTAEGWPPAGVHDVTMYLQADDTLHGERVITDVPSIERSIDPLDPTPSLGGGNLTTPAGPFDQTTIDARSDVYVVQTAAATEPVEIIGNLRAELWVASATSDLDVIVRAEVLTPMGKAVAFADGIRRGRFTDGLDVLHALTPGKPAVFDIELGPMAVTLPVGYALRVAISSVSAPRYEPNPNVADALATASAPQATKLTLFRDSAHPSRVIIPVASGELPGTVEMPDGGTPMVSSDAGLPDAAISGVGSAAGVGAGGAAGFMAGTAGVETLVAPDGDGSSGGCGCRTVNASSGASGWGVLTFLGVSLLRARRRRAR